MVNFTWRLGVFKLLAAILIAGATIPIASFATHNADPGSGDMLHVVTCPIVQPDGQASCTAEAVAYAAAVVSLQDAQKAANEAYRRWYECQYRGMDVKPVVEIPSSEFSVLVRD